MSAITAKADHLANTAGMSTSAYAITSPAAAGALNVRFVPLATIRPQQFAALFDDLVGAGKQRGRK